MKIKFSKSSIGMLNAMLRNPSQLSGGSPVPVQAYKATDEVGARQTRRVVRWLEKVLGKEREFKEWAGRIEKVYIERIVAVVDHYKDIGYSAYLVNDYLTLKDELEGKELDDGGIEGDEKDDELKAEDKASGDDAQEDGG